jgi:hypothetical protein
MRVKWTVLLFVWALLSGGMPLNWMAGGNWTQANFDILRGKINAFDPAAVYSSLAAAGSTLSDELGTLWAPAWNVVIVYYGDGKNYDAVLYGYGFNRHWFWLNGFKLTNNRYLSFVIWKDYNCVGWKTINPRKITDLWYSYNTADNNAITSKLQGGYPNRSIGDIWLAAQDIQTTIATTGGNIYNDKDAYTVVAA